MEITPEHRNRVEEIIRDCECPKDFECYKSGFENLCKVEIVVRGRVIGCLDARARECKYAMPFGRSFFCKCPLRKYIAENFGK